jgi:glycosyltransferase involved in cell wall biosynthesis
MSSLLPKKILVLDTGKEWGGGTNSLIELLKRTDRSRYSFEALFYHNYPKGDSSDIRSELERIGVGFICVQQPEQALSLKIAKEFARATLFFNRTLRRRAVFAIECRTSTIRKARQIASILTKGGFDLLYMNNQPSTNLEGIMAGTMTGVPVLQHSRIETRLNPVEVRLVNEQLCKMICVSAGVRDTFVEHGVHPDKCTVVHNGIDSGFKPAGAPGEVRSRYGIADDEILVVSAGSLVRRKRFEDLIEAVSELSQQGRRCRCLILGQGPERERLERMAQESGLGESLIFTGFQSNPASFINAADIFVLPSEQEGLPRVILEAMLFGRPVVAADVTGPSELVVDGVTGFLVPPRDPERLAVALAALFDNRGVREDMGSRGRERVLEHFSISRYVNGVQEVFNEVLAA